MRPEIVKKSRRLTLLVMILLLLVLCLWQVEQNLTKIALNLATARARALAVTALNQAADEVIAGGVAYDELMIVTRDDQGQVRLIQSNTQALNQLATAVSLNAQSRLSAIENQSVLVPLGSTLGLTILAGHGPSLRVQLLPVGTVVASLKTEFQTAGINQTRHRILLTLTADVRLVIPTGASTVTAVTEVAIAESIIVGDVPESFVDVNNESDMLNLIP